MIGLSDTPSAERYSVVPVALRNALGEFVVPDAAAMRAAVQAMRPDGAGVLVTDPGIRAAGAYPHTVVTYAATVPGKLTAAQRADYARLIRYAVGDGQAPAAGGSGLAPGYLPLPDSLRASASAAATAIERYVAPTQAPAPTPSPSSTPTPLPTATGGDDGGGVTNPGIGDGGAESPAPPVTSPHGDVVPTASPSTSPVAATGTTPADPAAASRLAVLAALVLGTSALLARVLLPWVANRRS
jgi:hypothetical protein